ncbi:hypothetical protein CRU99_11675 [Malaciobacter mytili]|nr:ATP-binding cassette domain-containing protein [Malaciobacter mytili]RXI37609.1 hypothetical protein CRU99_11675 [Malaciobacter mytili]
MIYEKIEDAKEDLNWLLKRTTILGNDISTLSQKKIEQIILSLEKIDKNSLNYFYSNLFESLGYEKLSFSKSLDIKCLPTMALIPNLGIVFIYEQLSDGSFKIESKNGKKNIYKFEQNSVFAPIRRIKQVRKYSTAKEMFKEIALKQKKVLFYLAIATFCINTLALGTSLYSMQVYDRVVPTGAISTLIALTIGAVIAMFLELILKFSKSIIQDYSTKTMDLEYSNDIFNRFLKVRCDALPRSVGTITGKLQSYNSVRAFISNAAIFTIIDLPFSLIFLLVIVVIGGTTMGFIPVAFFIVAFLIGFLFRKKIIIASQQSSMASHKKTGLLVETVENIENIKATAAGFNILNNWNKLTKESIDDDIIIKHYSDISTYITQFLQQFSYISIVCIGAYLVTEKGELTMGSLIAMTILSGRILQPISQLPNQFVQWGKAKLAIDDLNNIYSLPSDNEGIERPLNPYLDSKDLLCSELKFSYNEKSQVMQLKHLEIKEGEKVAILGVIGSGKSTLLKILAGLYKPTEGSVYLNSIDIQMIKRDLINDTISYLPQTTKLFAGTLRDNLTFGLVGISDEEIIKASKLTDLIGLINALPNGLDTVVPEGGESVSGGQKQLIALTRLLISNKDIMLLDEPTASMDDGTEKKIISMLKQELKEKQTMIVVTHKPIVLNMVDRIIVLTPKGIVMDGKKEDVLAQLNTNQIKKVIK